MARILVIEDEISLRSSIRRSLELDGHGADEAGCLRDAYDLVARHEFDAVITDLNLVGESGMELIKRLRADGNDALIVVITAHGTVDTAIEALRSGADEFIQKPVRLDELGVVIRRGLENRRLKGQLDLHQRLHRVSTEAGECLGSSPAWTKALSLSKRFGSLRIPSEAQPGELPTILILGETGTGKGVIARHIHTSDPTCIASSPTPFVHVNCAALPPNLIEAELFGHEKGAFTDAKAARAGLFELAEGGTIFLDEIGEMALDMQAKLLLVVERGIFRRIGGTKERRVRARIVAATNQDLDERVRAGSFRPDLLFRLNALTINVPPLRERGDDALTIADTVLAATARQFGRPSLRLSGEARDLIRMYSWPGNTRQLFNAIRRAVILCDDTEIEPEHLGLGMATLVPGSPLPAGAMDASGATGGGAQNFDFTRGPVTFESIERRLIVEALRHAHGNVSLAAKLIGLNRGALRYRIERLGLENQVREASHR